MNTLRMISYYYYLFQPTNRFLETQIFIMLISVFVIGRDEASQAFAQTSDYFGLREIKACDDGGVYYLRQVDELGKLFWFGQEFSNDPAFANVFFGRLYRGVGVDSRGNRIDRWEGRFFDVPKGKTCRYGFLRIQSLVVPPNSRIAGCDFPSIFLQKGRFSAPFDGTTWGLENNLLGCWEDAPTPRSPLPLGTWLESVNTLSSVSIPAGFEGNTTENLSGTWLGNDGGTYYINDVNGTHELVWFAEHPSATPGVPGRIPPSGWANVFIGYRAIGNRIEGTWADVPRGGANRYGTLALQIETPFKLRTISQTGGYGEPILWRYQSLSVEIDIPNLEIRRAEDGDGDEARIEVIFAKMDGDGINRTSLTTSHAILVPRNSGRLRNDFHGGTIPLVPEIGHFGADVKTIVGASSAETIHPATMIGIAVSAWDDDSSPNSRRIGMFEDWYRMLQSNLDSDIRRGRTPGFVSLAGRRHFRWDLWTNDDDHLGYGARAWRFADLLAIAGRGGSEEFVFEMTGDGAHYVVRGTIRVTSRINLDCRW